MILRRPLPVVLLAALPLLATAACGDNDRERSQLEASSPARDEATRLRQSIESATFTSPTSDTDTDTANGEDETADSSERGGAVTEALPDEARPNPAMARAQILLDRTRFSPGIIDGLGGDNTRQAIAAFQEANDLEVTGELDAKVFEQLTSGDSNRVLTDYTLTEDDVAGPFIGTVPEDIAAMGELETVGYADAREALAEKFHMSEALLDALNPGVDFGRAGQTIVVAATGPDTLDGKVARIEVTKAENSLRAFDADGKLLAFYPATIGSSETPSPSGSHTVRAIAPRPNYTYDPSMFGESGGKVIVPPGPNNPVGAVWIDLSRDGYGIHGTPEPAKIGKTASSGCVRLTNWDVEQLASAVEEGVEVEFV
ncbi:L,D-transpeptidase family protein [Brevundimonas halotolerans]|jgi:lipoprotein-anchoring transpeptidase ErfK/SrfK|uniref:Lipoprotein-anchoring transpeptidase ErfK/SrfK n=1 Tax=Brevundimonas halotolerans TaxID=69670 RepID=A0A7W9E983_9CAUL|nr:L,D-transpeptidase [Brevundimonas halotolerans]MBB5661525.1 lipoprotein-anchoring transpeptidase ErfK/SrfK [Brevundimonas halotolerans]